MFLKLPSSNGLFMELEGVGCSGLGELTQVSNSWCGEDLQLLLFTSSLGGTNKTNEAWGVHKPKCIAWQFVGVDLELNHGLHALCWSIMRFSKQLPTGPLALRNRCSIMGFWFGVARSRASFTGSSQLHYWHRPRSFKSTCCFLFEAFADSCASSKEATSYITRPVTTPNRRKLPLVPYIEPGSPALTSKSKNSNKNAIPWRTMRSSHSVPALWKMWTFCSV